MLKYLVILLDDTSTSYCHYENEKTECKLISLEDLKAGIFFAMKENLMIQFVYPAYYLPKEYKEVIHSIDHSKIVTIDSLEKGDVLVINNWECLKSSQLDENKTYVLRLEKRDFFSNTIQIRDILRKVLRLNIAITDIETFSKEDFDKYDECLKLLLQEIENLYANGRFPQLNLLTDRIMLTAMNNCNAGWENITLAPDGKFYVCPAFYQANSKTVIEDKAYSIGDLQRGLYIKNPQLYKLTFAPLCRNCDAYQCKRCIWLNCMTTLEVNTPSHEQCVVAHLERNTSRELLHKIRKYGDYLPDVEIKEISYLDPFDVRKEL